jgi:nicotinate-nucleotide adenylyltransferase
MAKPGLEAKQLASWRDGKAAAWAQAGLRIGLFGGSFNPAHGGHRHVALSAMNALKLDAVIWLVAPQNPLKSSQDMAEYDRRLVSTRKIAEHPRMVVSDSESRLGHFFTADSLRW